MTFAATGTSTCPLCLEPIKPGDEAETVAFGEVIHAECHK